MDIKSKEQEVLDQRLWTLEMLSRSPTAPLRQQLSTIAITSQHSVPNLPVNGDPFANNGGGRGNLPFTTNPAIPRQGRPPFTPRPPPTPEQKAEIRLLLNKLPHHPDTQAGRQAYQAQQAEWVKTHGYGTKVTERKPRTLYDQEQPP